MTEYSLVALHYPSAITIEVPSCLEAFLNTLIESHHSHFDIVEFSQTTSSDEVQLARARIETTDEKLQLQKDLQRNKIPFWLEVAGSSDNYAQLYGNYFNGEYRCKAIEPDDELVAATDALAWHKQGCLEEKCQKVIDRCEPWVFTQEDVAVANQIMLRHIVKPGDKNG